MMQSVEAERLLLLLRCALNGEAAPTGKEAIDLAMLYKLACKQGVDPIIHDLLLSDPLLQEQQRDAMIQRNLRWIRTLAVRECFQERIYRALHTAKIRFIPLKGAIFSAYYPRSSMRTSSDLDLLYEGECVDHEAITQAMQTAGATKWVHGKEHSRFWFDTFLVELHPTLFATNDVFDSYFSTVWDRAQLQEDSRYAMCAEDLYLYHLAHMVKHMLDGGIGIRFLCDLYVFSKAQKTDRAYLEPVLTKLGILRFSESVDTLVQAIFSLDGKPSETQKRWISYFLSGDMYGCTQLRVLLRGRRALGRDGHISFLYYFRRVFPKFRDMKWAFPVLKWAPFLLPFCYTWRWIRAMLFRRRHISLEMQEIQKIDANRLSELLAFYDGMGIDGFLLEE